MKTVVLLTKQYPFGHLETYLNNEMEVFSRQFDRVILVPVDAYRFHELNPRISNWKNVEVFKINEFPAASSPMSKIVSMLSCLSILFKEILRGREGMMHLRRFRFCLTYLKVCYAQSTRLHQFLKNEGLESEPIVLYSYWLHKTTIVASMYRDRFRPATRNVSRAHSSDLYHKDWNAIIKLETPPFLPFENYKIQSSDHIYTISNHGCNYLKTTFPGVSDRFSVSRLGVMSPAALGPFQPEGVFRIVTCSEILFNKRLHRIPEILSLLGSINVEWVHIGWGLEEDMVLMNQEISRYGVQDKAVLLGRQTYSEVIGFYQNTSVNVILNLSQAEGIPVSIMEAISFGVPGIATTTVGNPEIVDETCGFQIPIEFTAQEVAEKILMMANDQALQQKLRMGARKMFETRYNAENNYAEFATLLQGQLR